MPDNNIVLGLAAHARSLDPTLVTTNDGAFTRVEGLTIESWAKGQRLSDQAASACPREERARPAERCPDPRSGTERAPVTMFADLVPILFMLLLAFGVLWILWRVVRRLLRSPVQRQEPVLPTSPDPRESRQEPPLRAVASSPSAIPDAADVLALKATIDNLARQVAALERRLASDQGRQPASQPPSHVKAVERPPIPSEIPPVGPGHRL